VRPRPPACLPGERAPGAVRLAAASARLLDRGETERALHCADEAVRADARSVAALRQRGAVLAELGRLEESRAAYERALAVEPSDPETLLGAAGLLVERSGGERQALETGLAHALRGVEAAARAPRAARDLEARLLLVAAMAENDLGQSREALRHAEAGLEVRPGDADLRYERGVALYELCRFREAAAELSRVLAEAPDDPWALHYLGLAAERRGEKRAAALLARAAALAPAELARPAPPSREAFAAEVKRALAALPEEERRLLAAVPVDVEDLPAVEDLTAASPPLSPSILGLFRGPPVGEACLAEDGPRCRSIVLYRLNLARVARDPAELAEQVRITLLHEVGHLRGEDDEELRARGLE
jgi:predicted Zn-dependent protease with MMP-like domain/Flp pilus assembly protein TadD